MKNMLLSAVLIALTQMTTNAAIVTGPNGIASFSTISGQSTNVINGLIRDSTISNSFIMSSIVYPTNSSNAGLTNYFWQFANGLVLNCSNAIFSHVQGGTFQIHPGDDLVFAGQGQFKVLSCLNPTQAVVVNYISGNANSFTQQPTAYYPMGLAFTDINRQDSGGIDNGGAPMALGNFGSPQPGLGGGQGGSVWSLDGTNTTFTGLNSSGAWSLYRVINNSQTPNPITVDKLTGNYYEAVRVRDGGFVEFHWGTTNLGNETILGALSINGGGVITGNGSGLSNITARADLTFQTNTIYSTTNTAPLGYVSNPLVLANNYTTPNAQGFVTVSVLVTNGLVGTADWGYLSNVTTLDFIPLGDVNGIGQTNFYNATMRTAPNDVVVLTNVAGKFNIQKSSWRP